MLYNLSCDVSYSFRLLHQLGLHANANAPVGCLCICCSLLHSRRLTERRSCTHASLLHHHTATRVPIFPCRCARCCSRLYFQLYAPAAAAAARRRSFFVSPPRYYHRIGGLGFAICCDVVDCHLLRITRLRIQNSDKPGLIYLSVRRHFLIPPRSHIIETCTVTT